MIGYVQIHRQIMDWEWYQCPKVSRLWFHLILKVNFKDKKWQGKLIKRGQVITSNEKLASDLSLTIQVIRTALQKLKDSGCIKITTTNKYTLITVVNYHHFQSSEASNNNQNNIQKTNKQQTNNTKSTTTKEGKKENNLNKVKINERRNIFKNKVFALTTFNYKVLNDFFKYWSELNANKTMMRCEAERFFEIEKRLEKWNKTEKFSKGLVSISNEDDNR